MMKVTQGSSELALQYITSYLSYRYHSVSPHMTFCTTLTDSSSAWFLVMTVMPRTISHSSVNTSAYTFSDIAHGIISIPQ